MIRPCGCHFTYDAWNRLAEVKSDNGGSPGSTIATYRYDGLNRRISKNLTGGDTFDYYHNEGWQLLETRKNAEIDPYEQYVWDQRYIDAPVLRWQDTDTNGTVDETLYYTNDANMNVTALVDSSGTVQERYAYDPYGKAHIFDGSWNARTSSAHDNPILYAGYRYDSESGLCHVRYRYYHLTIGRWTSQDPLGKSGTGMRVMRVGPQRAGLWPRDAQQRAGESGDGANLYQYVRGNPLIYVDPQGLQAASPSCYCGPDITGAVANLLQDVDTKFAALNAQQQQDLCDGYINAAAWDTDLFRNATVFKTASCPTGKQCEFDNKVPGEKGGASVTVGGKCYSSYDVNYVLYGRMEKNCGLWNATKANFWFNTYKQPIGTKNTWRRYFQASMWLNYGRGVIDGAPEPPANLKTCQPCGDKWAQPIGWYVIGNNGVKIRG